MKTTRFSAIVGIALIGCVVTIFFVIKRYPGPPSIAVRSGIVVVNGPVPRDGQHPSVNATHATPPRPQISDDHTAEIASTIQRTYPIVRDVRIACDDRACEVSVTPKPSSSADEDRIADALLDGGLDRILSGYGYHSTAPVVVDVLGGVNIDFRQSVTRP